MRTQSKILKQKAIQIFLKEMRSKHCCSWNQGSYCNWTEREAKEKDASWQCCVIARAYKQESVCERCDWATNNLMLTLQKEMSCFSWHEFQWYCLTSIGVLSEARSMNAIISLKYIVTSSKYSGVTGLPSFSCSATALRSKQMHRDQVSWSS